MRKLLVLIFALASLYSNSQTTCSGAQPFCAGGASGITFPATTGTGNAPVGPDYGCLFTTPNAAWYYLQIGTSGSLNILIAGQQNGNAGQDVDFICWGPFSSLAGACNSLTAGNTVDCSYSGSYTETLNIPNGVNGQFYMVLITNFANVTQDIIFNQQSGTGNTDCSILQASSPTICAGSTATITASNSSSLTSPNYSINPGGLQNNTGNFFVSPSTTTHYTLYVTGLNSQNAVITETALSTVVVNPQPVVAPVITQASCSNTLNSVNLHLTFNPPTPAPGYTVAWSGSNPNIISSSQTSVTTLGVGPYTVVTTAAGGCSVVTLFTIDPTPAQPIFTLTPLGNSFTLTCTQPTLILYTTNSNLTYTFTNGSSAPIMDTEAPITTTNVGNGHYTVTATNPVSGCTLSSTFDVSQSFAAPPISITPTLQNISCVTTATTVTATTSPSLTNTTFVFTAEQGAISTIHGTVAIYPPPVGTHTVCATNDANGCSTCKTFTVTSSDQFPSLSVTSADNFTVGCGVGYNQAAVTLSTQAASGTQFTIVPAPSPTNPALGGLTQYTFTNDGNYIAIVKDLSNGCETQVPFSIISMTQTPNIDANIPQTVLSCAIPSTALSAITTNTHVSYTWSYPSPNGPLSVSNSTVQVTTNPTLGITLPTYTLTIKDMDNGCVSTKLVQLQQSISSPSAHISGGAVNNATSAPITCTTPSVNLNNASTTTIPLSLPRSGPVSVVEWDGPSPQTPAQFLTNYQAFTPGTYTLNVVDQNNGCISSATFLIIDNRQYPDITITNSIPSSTTTASSASLICGGAGTGLSVVILNSNGLPSSAYSYSWSAPQPLPAANSQTLSPLTVPGKYFVGVRNNINGCLTNANYSLSPGHLSAGFTPDHVSGYAPLAVSFANNTNAGGDNNNIITVWSFGNGTSIQTSSATVSPVATYTQAGTYTVTIYASRGAACQDTAVRVITVDIPSIMEIPNVFTPNGDDINDFFFLKASNLTEIHAMIYDRWGHKVYDLTSTTGNISWDGKNDSDGKDAAAGTYFYIIKATGKDGQTYNNKGTVNLYR